MPIVSEAAKLQRRGNAVEKGFYPLPRFHLLVSQIWVAGVSSDANKSRYLQLAASGAPHMEH